MPSNSNLEKNKITNLANPINALDAAKKRYVEAVTNDFFKQKWRLNGWNT